jgi:sugar phosphate isomerase/epimerase
MFVVLLVVMAAFVNSYARLGVIPIRHHPTTDVYDRWRLGTQAYTFRKFTFYEAVDKTASLGLHWIEAYPGQKLSKEKPDVTLHYSMSPKIREEIKKKLAETRVKLINYGVVRLPNDEAECRRVFDFAKDMGIETIVAEPKPEAFDLVDRLCREYKIKVAIHNHPKDSRYWHPDKVLEACKGRSKWIGACADTGHWMRSGVNPLEALRKLEGRIISLHFKDLNQFGERKAHDVVWGTGKANVKAMLEEPEIRQCVEYFNNLAGQLNPTGWRGLLANDLSNCIFKPESWAMENAVLTRKGTKKGRSDIWTKQKYGDFILDLEFKLAEKTNSGNRGSGVRFARQHQGGQS